MTRTTSTLTPEERLIEAIKTNSLAFVLKMPPDGETPTTYYFHNKPFFAAEKESDQEAAALFPDNLCIFLLPSENISEGLQRYLLTEGYTNQAVNEADYKDNLDKRRQLLKSRKAAEARDAKARTTLSH
jgi:hypothetical protein